MLLKNCFFLSLFCAQNGTSLFKHFHFLIISFYDILGASTNNSNHHPRKKAHERFWHLQRHSSLGTIRTGHGFLSSAAPKWHMLIIAPCQSSFTKPCAPHLSTGDIAPMEFKPHVWHHRQRSPVFPSRDLSTGFQVSVEDSHYH